MILPKRWHIYIVNLEPGIGTKPGKQRPCLAIQPNEFSSSGLKSTVVIPLTTNTIKENAYPLRVRIPKGICGLVKDSDLLIDQVLAWDNSLFKEDLGAVPSIIQIEAKGALKEFLDLDYDQHQLE